MTKVRLVQLLCQQRHCFIATAYEAPGGVEMPQIAQRLRIQFDEMAEGRVTRPKCLICGGADFHTEDRATNWATMQEAYPHLMEHEKEQAATNAYFRASRG